MKTSFLLLATMMAAGSSSAQPPASQTAPAVEKNDYSKAENWLCRPGRADDACAIDLTTTIVAPDGSMTKETWTANPKAPIDCFYVYPTVSADQSPVADMTAGFEERNVIRQQFARFASAMLLGTSVPVPAGKDVGGAFKRIPLCRSASQTGCLIAFASYRSTSPPPANTLFGRVAGEGMEAACTNPASLGGGSGPLRAYLTGVGSLIASSAPPKHQWVAGGPLADTPFVSVPGQLTARCARNEHGHFLEITVHGNPDDPRADDIPGDLGPAGKVQANWGLHLIDVNATMGNLIDIVRTQAKCRVPGTKC